MIHKIHKKDQQQPLVRFYHTPKSGGTTIANMIIPWHNFKRAHPKKNHVCIAYYPPKIGEIAVTVIRHPYSRFTSAFYHMVDACDEDFYYRHAEESDCNTMKKLGINFAMFRGDPNEFLRAIIDKNDPRHKEAKKVLDHFSIFKSQFYWLSDIFGFRVHPQLKVILRQENLEKEFTELARQHGQNPVWKTYNKRLSTNTTPLSDTSKTIIRHLYKDDFKHFDFDV